METTIDQFLLGQFCITNWFTKFLIFIFSFKALTLETVYCLLDICTNNQITFIIS